MNIALWKWEFNRSIALKKPVARKGTLEDLADPDVVVLFLHQTCTYFIIEH